MATLTTAVGSQATLRTAADLTASFVTSDNDLDQSAANAVLCSCNLAAASSGLGAPLGVLRFEVSTDQTTWTEVTTKDDLTGELKAFEVRVREIAIREILVPKQQRYFRAKSKGSGSLGVLMVPQQQLLIG